MPIVSGGSDGFRLQPRSLERRLSALDADSPLASTPAAAVDGSHENRPHLDVQDVEDEEPQKAEPAPYSAALQRARSAKPARRLASGPYLGDIGRVPKSQTTPPVATLIASPEAGKQHGTRSAKLETSSTPTAADVMSSTAVQDMLHEDEELHADSSLVAGAPAASDALQLKMHLVNPPDLPVTSKAEGSASSDHTVGTGSASPSPKIFVPAWDDEYEMPPAAAPPLSAVTASHCGTDAVATDEVEQDMMTGAPPVRQFPDQSLENEDWLDARARRREARKEKKQQRRARRAVETAPRRNPCVSCLGRAPTPL